MTKMDSSNFNKKMKAVLQTKQVVMKQAYDFFVATTPIDTGYARQHTTLKNFTITAKYPYASILDKGRHMTPRGPRGSWQAPNGMTEPTIEKFRQYIKSYTKRVG